MRNENHPSCDTVCEVQYSVKPRPNSSTMAGFGCGMTGSHCIPSDNCVKFRREHAKQQEMLHLCRPHPSGGDRHGE